jgi:hypothetical protein
MQHTAMLRTATCCKLRSYKEPQLLLHLTWNTLLRSLMLYV